MLWIDTATTNMKLDAEKLETLYTQHKSYGGWAVIGTLRDRDIALVVGLACEKDAVDWLEALRKKLS